MTNINLVRLALYQSYIKIILVKSKNCEVIHNYAVFKHVPNNK